MEVINSTVATERTERYTCRNQRSSLQKPQLKNTFPNSLDNSIAIGNLTLARRINESIMIGDNITITVLELQGSQVKIMINAPKNIPINRSEIHQKIAESNLGKK